MAVHPTIDEPQQQQEPDETSPLITTTATPENLPWHHLLTQRVVIVCLLLVIFLEIAVGQTTAPLQKIVEENVCRELFADLTRPEDPRCKSTAVQSYFAALQGWNNTFDTIPGQFVRIIP